MGNLSSENGLPLPEFDTARMNLSETELTLRMPGESRVPFENNSGTKRGFSDMVDLNLESSVDPGNKDCSELENDASSPYKSPASKTQVVGWPPVGGHRRNVIKSCKYVKVAVDGAPYLRKVDLEKYNCYQQLLIAVEDLFSCLTMRNYLDERKIVDKADGFEYVPVYEDKDGDWMMGGDVPWNIFVESCKRLRLMKRSEAIGLDAAPRAPSKCSSTR